MQRAEKRAAIVGDPFTQVKDSDARAPRVDFCFAFESSIELLRVPAVQSLNQRSLQNQHAAL